MNVKTIPSTVGKGFMSLADMFKTDEVVDVSKISKMDDANIKPNTWQNIDWMTPIKYDDAEGTNLLKSIYKHLDWENIKLGDEVTHTPIMTVSSLGNVVKSGGNRSTVLPPKNFM